MKEEEYINVRLEDQLNWYDNKSVVYQKRFKQLRALEIIFAACIPLLSAFPVFMDGVIKIVIAALGTAIVIIAGINAINKYQELWIEYRTTAETLKHHKFLYKTQSTPYNGEDKYQRLVENTEAIISKENSNWSSMLSKEDPVSQSL